MKRECSKPGCTRPAEFTLTYDYAHQVAAIGPAAPDGTSEGYDLCRDHALRFSTPQGWQVIRHLSLTSE